MYIANIPFVCYYEITFELNDFAIILEKQTKKTISTGLREAIVLFFFYLRYLSSLGRF